MPCIGMADTPLGKASIHIGRYPHGGAICIVLDTADGEFVEPLAVLSVNLVPYGDPRLAEDEFTIKDWSENTELIAPMIATGLFEDTGRRIPTGFVHAPVWRIANRHVVPKPPVQSGAA